MFFTRHNISIKLPIVRYMTFIYLFFLTVTGLLAVTNPFLIYPLHSTTIFTYLYLVLCNNFTKIHTYIISNTSIAKFEEIFYFLH